LDLSNGYSAGALLARERRGEIEKQGISWLTIALKVGIRKTVCLVG
jgi:hypothetical protein